MECGGFLAGGFRVLRMGHPMGRKDGHGVQGLVQADAKVVLAWAVRAVFGLGTGGRMEKAGDKAGLRNQTGPDYPRFPYARFQGP